MQSWPDAPILSNPFVKSVTSNSALVGATITNTGSSHLIDRGSNIVMHEKLCILGQNRMRNPTVAIGTFSENRIKFKK